MGQPRKSADIVEFRRAARERTEDRAPDSSQGARAAEVVMLPGMDFRAIAASLDYWRRTGKSWNGQVR